MDCAALKRGPNASPKLSARPSVGPIVGPATTSFTFVRARCKSGTAAAAAEGSGCDRCAVTEKFAFLDDLHYLRRNHPFPGAISRLQFGQCVGRINPQVLRMIIGDLFDVSIVD